MRTMGLDVGDRTIGVAVSDAMGLTAQGIETIRRTNKKEDYKRLEEIIKEKVVTKIIVGLPKNMDGTIGSQGKKVLQFVEDLKKRFTIEMILWDERLTSVAAEKTLISADVSRKKRKKVIDMLAATYILQGYLDVKK
ncbi:Holliday junction resolvase RuvX [Marinisporobacter balticus]|uniref:Putative pre-16S rRNA nuclease n=1 Tax=Marinisporobacter balticus TaxID=2018667 RepID=A0A4R2L5C3_9FIRM|nr:Holliday junction resolvase RuvX [Marinisporobacter balticus]TCO79076.1 putative Holliday junction resolvase [Marinisporobacter balticus]